MNEPVNSDYMPSSKRIPHGHGRRRAFLVYIATLYFYFILNILEIIYLVICFISRNCCLKQYIYTDYVNQCFSIVYYNYLFHILINTDFS